MTRTKFSWRNVATMVACLAAVTMFAACEKSEDDPMDEGAPRAPGAVINLTATEGDAQVVLTWNAPGDNGGTEITGYEVTMDNWATHASKTESELSHTYTGLTNGTVYTFKVRAVNAEGVGAESTATATPTGGSGGGNLVLPEGYAWVFKPDNPYIQAVLAYIFRGDNTYEHYSNMSGGVMMKIYEADYAVSGNTLTAEGLGSAGTTWTYDVTGDILIMTDDNDEVFTYAKEAFSL